MALTAFIPALLPVAKNLGVQIAGAFGVAAAKKAGERVGGNKRSSGRNDQSELQGAWKRISETEAKVIEEAKRADIAEAQGREAAKRVDIAEGMATRERHLRRQMLLWGLPSVVAISFALGILAGWLLFS